VNPINRVSALLKLAFPVVFAKQELRIKTAEKRYNRNVYHAPALLLSCGPENRCGLGGVQRGRRNEVLLRFWLTETLKK
jgi:hypothetical protein